jgi:vitamin B12 transporter
MAPNAIGGVVQVFTRRGRTGLSGNASAGYGSYRTWDATGGAGRRKEGWRFALQAAAKESRGFNAVVDPNSFQYNPDIDGYGNQSFSGNAGFTFAPDQEASVQ